MHRTILLATIATALSASVPAVFAQGSNDFFGSSIPGTSSPPGAQAAEQQLSGAGGGPTDYTQDEKRMQKKYRDNLRAAQNLIEKGDRMMKDGEKRHQERETKKGKILKEIGEKRVAELKANCPLPELAK
ncbi:MAG: hypothetical protein K2W82_03845 [Candidatus Obscuribacterales bacterium]|nr:hypothetical protein [Candidatus Obscuribacterales bacterium]